MESYRSPISTTDSSLLSSLTAGISVFSRIVRIRWFDVFPHVIQITLGGGPCRVPRSDGIGPWMALHLIALRRVRRITHAPINLTRPMPSTKENLIDLLEHEVYGTRMMLERAPEDHFGWKPHETSFSLGELAAHIAQLLQLMTAVAREDAQDLADTPDTIPTPDTRQALIDMFDANADALHEAVERLSPADLDASWQLLHGDNVLIDEPRIVVFYKMGLNHLVHHRGQLSVYLRMLNVPVPPTYGPTADEQATF